VIDTLAESLPAYSRCLVITANTVSSLWLLLTRRWVHFAVFTYLDNEIYCVCLYFRIKMVIYHRLKLQIYSVHVQLCHGVQK